MSTSASIPAVGLYGEAGSYPDVVHAEAIAARAPVHGWRISAHRRRHMAQLFLIARGAAQARADTRSLALQDHSFLYIPPSVVHGFVFEPQTTGLVLSFPDAVLSAIDPDGGPLRHMLNDTITGQAPDGLQRAAQTLHDAALTPSAFRSYKLIALAHFVLTELADIRAGQAASVQPAAGSGRLAALDTLIAAHMVDGWGVADYARALSLSAGHLSRLCRTSTGEGAAAYIEGRVMTEACRLLAFTRMGVAEVGYRLGYDDPSYFSKRFRKRNGQTPSEYRARFAR